MSFKLFFLQTFKGLKNTSKIETEFDNLYKDYQDFCKIEESDKLKHFLELEKEVNTDSFKQQKKQIQSLKFKGSPEEKKFKEFKKLESKSKLKTFYKVQSSSELKKYNELKGSEDVIRYQELKDYVDKRYKSEKSAFSKNKSKNDDAKFEDTDAYKKYQEYRQLTASADIKLFLGYPKSSDYRLYSKMNNSSIRKRFEELQTEVESDSFRERKAYLEDDKKWEKTEAYKNETDYLEMLKDPLFVNYLKYRNTNAFDFFKNWNLVFEDRFEADKLDGEKWQTITQAAEQTTAQNFSKEGDLQAYTNSGENVQVKGNHLQLVVKKEKTKTLVWNMPMGFTLKEMDYSAGLITTGTKFQPKYGILEAKIKFDSHKQLENVFYLADSANEYRLNLLECGKVNRFGLTSNSNSSFESLSGLSVGQFYIFRMEWTEGKITWKINNQEIYSISSNIPGAPMSLNLNTIVLEPTSNLPYYFEVGWIRFYQKK